MKAVRARRPAYCLLVVVAVSLAGCSTSTGSSGPAQAPRGTSAPAAQVGPSCAPAGPAAKEWPAAVPDSLPKPPGSTITKTSLTGPTTYVTFRSPVSLRAGTLFVVQSLTAAGFTLSRGDAEATEADAPFSGPTIVGALRLTRVADCVTDWVLAVQPRTAQAVGPGGVPVQLIPYHPGAAASPLPFG